MTARTLTDRQREVLDWIVAGCPARDWPDETYKLSARALETRRLAKVSRQTGVWTARATDAGRFYAEHGRYPDGHWKTANDRDAARRAVARREARAAPRRAPSPEEMDRRTARDLLKALRAQPSVDQTYVPEAETRSTMRLIEEMGLLKPGERLHLERGHLRLLPPGVPEDEAVARQRAVDIACPERLSPRPHKAVSTLKHSGHLAGMSAETRRRTLLCVQALVNAATVEGIPVSASKDGLTFRVGTQTVRLAFDEPSDRHDHVKTRAELEREARGWGSWSPRYDYTRSGRIRINGAGATRAEPRATEKVPNPWRWETRLNWLYDRILETAAEQVRRRREQEQREERRRQQYAADLVVARVAWAEHKRVEAFGAQVDAWHASERLRLYVEAMRLRAEVLEGPERAAADEWVGWADKRLQDLDPLTAPPAGPVLTEPSEGELQRFLPRRPLW